MALPLTLGIGLIFVVHVLQQSDQPRSLFSDSTGPAILLSALTTFIGFATLLAAEHRGVASLGLVMAVGVVARVISCSITCLSRPYKNKNPAVKQGFVLRT